MNNNQIVNSLNIIIATYQSICAFFYQKIIQTDFTNNKLSVYPINYTLLLPSSQFIINLNNAQVNAQMQTYINLCNVLITSLTLSVNTQTNLFYEQIQNILNISISQLNGFAINLLDAQYNSLFTYKVPYDMSLLEALYLNNINYNTYTLQATLNYNLQDFNNLSQNIIITLSN